jgi:2,3-bisphosphoglycerate-dependent phosphoglycerate mutase
MSLNGTHMNGSLGGDEAPTRIIAIRHGETAWNVQTRVQGQLDVPLNDTGRWQAQRLRHAVAHEALAAVYSSDLQRASETAFSVASAAGVPVRTDRELRERAFGIFEGHTFKEIEQRWPDESLRWRQRDPDFGPDGGETLRSFYARCVDAASRLAAAHPGQTIALVAHGGVMDCLYRAATRIELTAARTWQLGNASVNRLLFTPAGFTLVGWSDTSHIDRASPAEAAGAPGTEPA